MDANLDKMLSLTAEIADELLRLKDDGAIPASSVKAKICSLAELALNLEEEEDKPAEQPQETDKEENVPLQIEATQQEEVTKKEEKAATEECASETEIIEEDQNKETDEEVEPHQPGVSACVSANALRKAFSINDIFLFRRELFGGSDKAFSKALEDIAALQTFPHVREYVVSSLQLNPKRREVRDFLETLSQFY